MRAPAGALSRFEPIGPITIAWFGLYLALPINAAYYLWTSRRLRSANPVRLSPLWRGYLLVQGVAAIGYGIALLIAPADSSAFWPWKIDDFHARMYSAVFLTGGVGSLIVWRNASAIELATLGAIQVTLGGLAIVGLAIVDLRVRTVAWTAIGPVSWVAVWIVVWVTGLGLVWEAVNRRAAPVSRRAASDP